MIGRYFLVRPIVLPSRPVTLRTLPLTVNNEVRASGHYLAQRPVDATDACCCRATDRTRPVLLGRVRSPLPILFLRDLASGLVPIFVLDFA